MPTAASPTVVTKQRYAQGVSFADFLSQATVNQDKLQNNYTAAPISDDDVKFLKQVSQLPNGPKYIMTIAEAWCGDVCRELPVMARWAELAGIDMRIFLRDQNPDIMDEFLNGVSRSIPVFAFYTADMRYIGHFTERSAAANAGLNAIRDEISDALGVARGTKLSTLSDAQRQEFLRQLRPKADPFSGDWQKAAISEIKATLSQALGLPVVYTIRGCEACVKLLAKWNQDGVIFEERRVELSQATLDQARKHGDMVPIVVWPDGRSEQGFGDSLGCFI